jgi:hypothetical protein
MKATVQVEWKNGPVTGTIETKNGNLAQGQILKGKGTFKGNRFSISGEGACRLSLTIDSANLDLGANVTTVSMMSEKNPFTFFLRDVRKDFPIYIPAYGVMVTTSDDDRSYDEIASEIQNRHLTTTMQQIKLEPEESFDQAAAQTRKMECPIWLGVSRDNRIFEFDFYREGRPENQIIPKYRWGQVTKEELEDKPLDFRFFLGRGVGCKEIVKRHLDEGVLPILHGTIEDENIHYECTAFTTLEKSELKAGNVRGTNYLFADSEFYASMFTDEQKKEVERQTQLEKKLNDEEVVFFFQAKAINTSKVPRYAYFQTANFYQWVRPKCSYDGRTGLNSYKTGRVFAVSKFNGKPMPQEEMAVLLGPGETATMEFYLPHGPISKARALALSKRNYDQCLTECRAFWKAKLDKTAKITLPDRRIDEMIRAGILHLDLVMYGQEPKGTLAPTIGVYSPIGSESSPIIQFTDSMARHEIAERCLQYFIDKQHDDGFIQNFNNYMLETGAALWSLGEHYRYTHDDRWVKKILTNLLKACDYQIAWRKRNMTDALRGKGYGMMEGKVADPEDHYHIFMLNGYAYLGMMRVVEMIEKIDPASAQRIRKETQGLLKDVLEAFKMCLARGPVVPLGDGTWVPTSSPWVEHQGPCCLFAQGEKCYSHGTYFGRDAMLGPIYLILQEVLDPKSTEADFLMNFHTDMMCMRNAAFSQPYYSPHPLIHLKLGEVKAFLKAYFNTVSALADRETYTFWEHLYRISPHKTHEEGGFLMQTRWMLWMEENQTLKLLPGVPRDWLSDGKKIELENVASYFGPVSLKVTSNVRNGKIEAIIECKSKYRPEAVEIRLPHPLGQKPTNVRGGKYCTETETIQIERFTGQAAVVLTF